MPVKPNSNITFQPITVDITSRIIDSLKPKTSNGVDCISNKLLKFVKNAISEPLTTIINQMLNTGVFPDLLIFLKLFQYTRKRMTRYFQITGLYHCYPPFPIFFEKVILEQLAT